jgi:putative hydrolase of the HAD superfamily
MKYQHLFFDLDHTLWDFESNCRLTLSVIFEQMQLASLGISDFDAFYKRYIVHNDKLWERYRNGFVKVDELRWKRMWLTLLDFKIGNEKLARELGIVFLDLLPTRTLLFPYTLEILRYLKTRKYQLHLITNGFEKTQYSKLEYSGIRHFFTEVITSEGSNSLKPHKEIFEYALKKASANSAESIMIGDSLDVDILGALNAGIDQVYVNHIDHKPAPNATYTVYSLRELEQIF